MEQRQPVLDAWVALTSTDRLIERIIAGVTAEQLDIAGTKQLLAVRPVSHFADRHENQLLHDLRGALRLRIERFNALQRIAKKVEPHRAQATWRIEIEDAASHCEFTCFHHLSGAGEACRAQTLDQPIQVDALASRHRTQRLADERPWRQFLQNGVDRRQNDRWLAATTHHELCHCSNALGGDFGIWAYAVVGNSVPRRKRDHALVRCKKRQCRFQRIKSPIIAGDVQNDARCRLRSRLAGKLSQHQGIEPLGHSG